MKHNLDFISELCKKLRFPEEATACFEKMLGRLEHEDDFCEEFDDLLNEYLYPQPCGLDLAAEVLAGVAERYNANVYTLNFVFLLCCTPVTKERYDARGISESVFYDTMADMRCKLLECMECKQVPGSFVPGWYDGFFSLNRFALGRFQFEHSTFGRDTYVTKQGLTLKKDTPVFGFHIPSSGISLTDKVRFDSYHRAYEFFKEELNGGVMVLKCSSWLLYAGNRNILPPGMNILRFMDDFELLYSVDREDFGNAWRIFGRYAGLPAEELPEDTRLKKAFKERLLRGEPVGDGFGIIVFDGERIVK